MPNEIKETDERSVLQLHPRCTGRTDRGWEQALARRGFARTGAVPDFQLFPPGAPRARGREAPADIPNTTDTTRLQLRSQRCSSSPLSIPVKRSGETGTALRAAGSHCTGLCCRNPSQIPGTTDSLSPHRHPCHGLTGTLLPERRGTLERA